MSFKLTRGKKETTINFNEGEPMVNVFTICFDSFSEKKFAAKTTPVLWYTINETLPSLFTPEI